MLKTFSGHMLFFNSSLYLSWWLADLKRMWSKGMSLGGWDEEASDFLRFSDWVFFGAMPAKQSVYTAEYTIKYQYGMEE